MYAHSRRLRSILTRGATKVRHRPLNQTSTVEPTMLPHVLALPGKHWHGPHAGADRGCNIQQIGVDLPTVEYAVEELPLSRCQVEKEGKFLSAERDGFLNPSVDSTPVSEIAARQTNHKLLPKLARVTFDGID